ncbi:MAG: zinc ribbon domain-containing protein [Bacilli bacterium]|nr:zinc ribbon domain-containing protein [Bacilli bacterium]
MFCTNCGTKIEEGAVFCTECGTKVDQDTEVKTVKIKVIREKRTMGFAIPFPVYIDGEKVATLSNGAMVEVDSTSGHHLVEFVCADGNVKQEIDIPKDHECVEIKFRTCMGLIAASAKITSIEYK